LLQVVDNWRCTKSTPKKEYATGIEYKTNQIQAYLHQIIYISLYLRSCRGGPAGRILCSCRGGPTPPSGGEGRRGDSPSGGEERRGFSPRRRSGPAGLLPKAAASAGGASPPGGGGASPVVWAQRRGEVPLARRIGLGGWGDGSGEGVSCKNTMGRRALKCKKRVSRSCPSDERWLVQIVGLHGCTDCWFAQDTLPFYPVLHR